MLAASEQLCFQFHIESSFLDDDFVIAPCNQHAMMFLQQWPRYNEGPLTRCLILHGPHGCGKTHLAHSWQRQRNATFLTPLMLSHFLTLPNLPAGTCYILEDIDDSVPDETLLFHTLNRIMGAGCYLLMTSLLPASALQITLPDLASRLGAFPSVGIHSPDDELLKTLLLKGFMERQLLVPPEVVDFIALRIERSFSAVHAIVAQLDHYALTEKRNITTALVRSLF